MLKMMRPLIGRRWFCDNAACKNSKERFKEATYKWCVHTNEKNI